VLTKRLTRITGRLIFQCQTAFIKGRFILESVVSAHEIVHEVYRKKQEGFSKIDYEKGYDRANLDLLYEILALRGFGPVWIRIIK
jgi:hypothetical protein